MKRNNIALRRATNQAQKIKHELHSCATSPVFDNVAVIHCKLLAIWTRKSTIASRLLSSAGGYRITIEAYSCALPLLSTLRRNIAIRDAASHGEVTPKWKFRMMIIIFVSHILVILYQESGIISCCFVTHILLIFINAEKLEKFAREKLNVSVSDMWQFYDVTACVR